MDEEARRRLFGSFQELLEIYQSYLRLTLGLDDKGLIPSNEPYEALSWCPEHAFVVVTEVQPYTTGLLQCSCGCPLYTKARIVTYEEAIEIIKGIKHAQSGGVAKFRRDGIHISVVRYEGTEEKFESYCRQVSEVFQRERVKR